MSEDKDVWRAIGRAGGVQSNGMSVGTLAVRVLRDVVLALGLDMEHAEVADIAPAVEALRARVAELEAAARWMPVGERLPPFRQTVLVHQDGVVFPAYVSERSGWLDDGRGDPVGVNPTHWRHLPLGPEVGQ